MIPASGCAHANRLAGEDPIGTATPYDQVFLLQIPPPWARNVLDDAAVPDGVRQALIPALKAGRRPNVLLIDGAEPLVEGAIRVLHYRLPEGSAGPCTAAEYLVAPGRAADLIGALSVGSHTLHAPGVERRASPVRDVLICTHGQRDGCCGRYGDVAYRRAAAWLASPAARSGPPGTRVWRVSHLGGHRFAPTLLDLPSGRLWGKLTEPALELILSRAGKPSDLRGMYRGWLALEPAAQVLERELLAKHGWPWLAARVQAEMAVENGTHRVRLQARLPDGAAVVAEAEIVAREPIVLPLSCGADESAVPQYAFAAEPPDVSVAGADRSG